MKTTINDKNKAIGIVIMVVVLLSGAYFFEVGRLHLKTINQLIQAEERSINSIIKDVEYFSLEPYKQRVSNLLDNHEEIVRAFAQRDRDALYRLALPKYKSLQNENSELYVMHFHLPDGTTLLRMHWPDYYGDDLTEIRPIVHAVHQLREQQTGYEIGRQGAFYRIVHPVFYHGDYIGALELGIRVHQIKKNLQKQIDSPITSFFLADEWRKVVEGPQYKMISFGRHILNTHDDPNFMLLPRDFDFTEDNREIQIHDSTYLVHTYPIFKNHQGATIGGILVLQDISQAVARKGNFVIRFFLFAGVLLAISICTLYLSFNKVIGKLEKSGRLLKNTVDSLKMEIEDRKQAEEKLNKTHICLKMALQSANIGTWDWNPVTNQVIFSPECLQQLGMEDKGEPFRFADWEGRLHHQDRTGALASLRQYLEGRLPKYAVEFRLRHTDGSYRWIYSQGEAMFDGDGKPCRLLGCHMDITERKVAEEALRESEEKYRCLLENITHGIAMINADYTVATVNKAIGQGFQAEARDFIGKYCFREFQQRDTVCPDCPGTLAMATGSPQSIEMTLLKGERLVERNKTAFPLASGNGHSSGFVLIIEDMTERRQAEKSLRQYKHIVNASQDQMAFVDRNYVYIMVNETYLQAHNRKREEIIGRKATEVFDPEIFARVIKEKVDKALAGETIHYQYWYDYPLQGRCYMDVVYSPFIDKEGNVSGIVVNSRDITRRKLAEEELKKYQYIVSASRDHMAFVDRNYVYQAVNDAYLRDFKKGRDGIVGHSVTDLLGREKFESLVKRKLDLAFGGKHVQYESWFDFPRRGTAFMEVRYYPFYDDDNRITGVVVNSRDITERKKTEERLREAQKKEALGTLAGGIAHDFNNILGAIIGCTELTLLDTPPGTPSHSHLMLVRQAAQRAVDLVKQILCFSRQQKGEYKPAKIIPLIKEAMKMVRASLPATIEIRLSIETDNDVVQADLTHIHQMVMNLCTNAAHAMEEKGGLLLLRLAAMSHSDIPTQQEIEPGPYIMLAIIDTGHGIEKSIRERIFDPYFTTKEVGKGTGLGLAIVHSIVKNHKGIIELYSEENKGTTVQVYLPLFNKQAAVEKNRETSLPTGNECILFVDDEAALAQTGKEILERFGYKVFMKTGSEEALQFFREYPDLFDLVISDQTMPRMAGMELLREIMRIRPGIPMVLCTGYSDSVDADLAESCGISHFMLKPLAVRNLIETVRNVLDNKIEGMPEKRG